MNRDEAEARTGFDVRSACTDAEEILASIKAGGHCVGVADLSGLSIDDAANLMTLLVMIYERLDAELWSRFHDHPVTTILHADASLRETEERMRAYGRGSPDTEEDSP